jgi:hypothetical protein
MHRMMASRMNNSKDMSVLLWVGHTQPEADVVAETAQGDCQVCAYIGA